MRRLAHAYPFLPFAILAIGCAQPDAPKRSAPTLAFEVEGGGEGEVFGNVYDESGQRSSNVWVTLDPYPGNQPSLLHQPFLRLEWADPASPRTFMWDWADPDGGSGRCGNLAQYNAGTGRLDEVHRPGPNQQASGPEQHCVRPGSYSIGLSHNSDGSAPFWSVLLDFLQVRAGPPVWNQTAGVSEYVEYPFYADTITGLTDLAVDYTAEGAPSHADTLDVDNAGSDWGATTFANNANPTGTTEDWFRFSVARTRSSWNTALGRGAYLARIYFDWTQHHERSTRFFNSTSAGVTSIRPHRYDQEHEGSRAIQAALEVITPGGTPPGPSTFRTVTVNTCIGVDLPQTWLTSDQVLALGCGNGTGYQYRWQTDSAAAWTDYSSSPRHDFLGYASAGTHLVTAQARDPSTGNSTSYARHLTALYSEDTINGRTYVTDKATNWYYNRPVINYTDSIGNWFEQWPPDTTWYTAEYAPTDRMGRIWPAGHYTVNVRWDSSTAAILRRSRLEITVCNPPRNCYVGPVGGGSPDVAMDSWGFFGGGLWLAARGAAAATRLYDLLGEHDAPSPFADRSWFYTGTGGTAAPVGVGQTVMWQPLPLGLADARAFGFTAGSRVAGPVELAVALDPDLGADASDDRTGFDRARSMVYVYDQDQAVGYMLRDSTGADALSCVTQYGLRRRPPRSGQATLAAMRCGGVSLLQGPSDVQLVVVPCVTVAPQTWTLVAVRGASLSELGSHADAALQALRPSR